MQEVPAEIQAMFGIAGKAVPRVKASDIKALWKMGRDAEAHAMADNPELKRGQIAIGADLMKHGWVAQPFQVPTPNST